MALGRVVEAADRVRGRCASGRCRRGPRCCWPPSRGVRAPVAVRGPRRRRGRSSRSGVPGRRGPRCRAGRARRPRAVRSSPPDGSGTSTGRPGAVPAAASGWGRGNSLMEWRTGSAPPCRTLRAHSGGRTGRLLAAAGEQADPGRRGHREHAAPGRWRCPRSAAAVAAPQGALFGRCPVGCRHSGCAVSHVPSVRGAGSVDRAPVCCAGRWVVRARQPVRYDEGETE